MAKRLHQTLADYVVIAISPALIMAMVGSLVFFLLTVFYQGEYPERLHWVMACFVFAAVLIGRISIEEGLERAMPFGIALAVVVGLATNAFMDFRGAGLDTFSRVINWVLIGLVWWCAHRLTWDCTVIDDSDDASGEGLLQTAGIEQTSKATGTTVPHELEGTTSRQVPAGWWQRYVERQHRPHAPGVWVVYFSLAALPLFGVGQWFIPATSIGLRRYAFWLLCVYVASGMGLLLTTSFLGLRRYLRQRRVEMPTMMANLWLGTGAVVIVVLLVVAALLPRPSAEYALAELPISLGSPGGKSSKYASGGREGAEEGEANSRTVARRDERAVDQDASPESKANSRPAPSGPGEQQSPPADDGGSEQPGQPPGGQQGNGQSNGQGQSRGQGKSQGRSSGEQSRQTPTNPLKQRLEKLRQQKQAEQSQPADQQAQSPAQPTDPSSQQSEQTKSQQRPADQRPDGQQPQDANADKSEQQSAEAGEQAEQAQAKQSDDQQAPEEKQQAEQTPPEAGNQTPSEPPQPQFEMPELPQPPLGMLTELVRWAFYAAFALAVAYFLWRYRAEVMAAIRDFLTGLRDLLSGLWGGKRKTPAAGSEPVTVEFPQQPFSTYADPFATGVAARYSLAELIAYSFEAFEAWSREHGCPHEPDQTPHELARAVAKMNAAMGPDARGFADLYSRAAYAQGELPDTAREQLRQLWLAMRRTAAANRGPAETLRIVD